VRHRLTKAGPGRPKGSTNKATREHKEFLRAILESEEYRESFKRRVVRGDAQLEQMMCHYVLGKPKDTLALENVPPLLVVDTLSDADVRAALAVRDES
jgi:hypothetical protein